MSKCCVQMIVIKNYVVVTYVYERNNIVHGTVICSSNFLDKQLLNEYYMNITSNDPN